jgi:hypothetical protein
MKMRLILAFTMDKFLEKKKRNKQQQQNTSPTSPLWIFYASAEHSIPEYRNRLGEKSREWQGKMVN